MADSVSSADLLPLLSGMASLAERIEGLLGLGLTISDLAATTSSTDQTIQNWARGGRATKGERTIDGLRLVAAIGLQRGHAPRAMANWLKSANPNLDQCCAPIEVIDQARLDVVRALAMEPTPENGTLTEEDERRLLTGQAERDQP